MEEILRAQGLTYVYSPGTPFEKTAVDNVNLSVNKGEFLALIGHTGSGKSTLIQHFNALLKPTRGQVFLHGRDIWESKEVTRKARFQVGLVFQYPEHQLFEETIEADVSFGPRNMGLEPEEVHRRVVESLAACGMGEDMLPKSPFDLSGGQKRRVALAGVLAMEPEVLVLDEPAAGLDPRGRDDIFRFITEYLSLIHISTPRPSGTGAAIPCGKSPMPSITARIRAAADGRFSICRKAGAFTIKI